MTARAGFALSILASLIVSVASPALADGDANYEKAKQLFEEGRNAMSESRYDAACEAFEESLKLSRGIGTRFNLAECEQRRGHLARARELFLEVAELARDVGQADRERVARERASAVEAELAYLKFELEGTPAQIAIDDRVLTPEAVREPVAIEVGTHRIEVSAPGKRPWNKAISVPKAGMYVVVAVPALPDEQSKPNQGSTETDTKAEASDTAVPSQEPEVSLDRGAGARRAALVLGGIGTGAVIAGVAFGLQFVSNNHDAKDVCPTSYGCTEDEIGLHQKFIDDARRARTWSYVGFGVGAAALAGAGLLYFTLGQSGSVSASTGFNADGSWNVALRGRY